MCGLIEYLLTMKQVRYDSGVHLQENLSVSTAVETKKDGKVKLQYPCQYERIFALRNGSES
jgi:hypothetical protein